MDVLTDLTGWTIPTAPDWLVGGLAGVALFAVLLATGRRIWPPQQEPTTSRPTDRSRRSVIALLAARAVPILGTAVCADGILQFLAGRGLEGAELYLAFAFLETATVFVATTARRVRRDTKRVGLLGKAVWVVGAASGVFAALGADSVALGAFRLVIALVCVFVWEIELFAEMGSQSTSTWAIGLERLLVKWGLKDPTGRDASAAELERRRARLVDAVYAAVITSRKPKAWACTVNRRWARATRLTMDAVRDGIIASAEDRYRLYDDVQNSMALPSAFSDRPAVDNPWIRPTTAPVADQPVTDHPVPALATDRPTDATTTDHPGPVPGDRPAAALRSVSTRPADQRPVTRPTHTADRSATTYEAKLRLYYDTAVKNTGRPPSKRKLAALVGCGETRAHTYITQRKQQEAA